MDPVIPIIRPRLINAEPVLLLISFGLGLYITIYQAFITFKICLTTAPGSSLFSPSDNLHDFCMNLVGSPKESSSNETAELWDQIEAASSRFMIYYQVVGNVPAILLAFMVGAWSDAFGRKPPLIIALAGSVIGGFFLVAAAGWDTAPSYLILISTFITGCTGQMVVIYSSAFSMISDTIQDPVKLTVRIGLASGVLCVGLFTASLSSGFILSRWDDYAYIFAAATVMAGLSFFYAVFLTQETLQFVKKKPIIAVSSDQNSSNVDGVTVQHQDDVCLDDDVNLLANGTDGTLEPKVGFCKTFCDLRRVQESWETLVRKRPGRRRVYLWVSIVAFLVVFACGPGMPGILNLLVKRPPISMSDSEYSYLMACGTGAMAIGMMVLPWIAERILHTTDSFLIILGLTLETTKMLFIAFSTQKWMIFLSSIVGGFSGIYFTGYRAFISKLVGRDETGRVFAIISSSEHIGPLVSALVFNNLFAATLHWFAGFVYLVAGIIMGIMLLIMTWIHVDSGRHEPNVENERQEINDEDDAQLLVA